MRRNERALTRDKMLEILNVAEYGVLSTVSEGGAPYGVPVSFVYHEGDIYFHCAPEGHKLDNIAHNDRVSFCAVADVRLVPDKFTTNYSSVIVFGRAAEVVGDARQEIFIKILEKFSREHMAAGLEYVEKSGFKAAIFRIEVERMTGKGRF
jgi:nitroimidazol reductase NimA-like FMN-containing flavoprotein (pyridoxamine 5'-phosphate oxidase superfamily)